MTRFVHLLLTLALIGGCYAQTQVTHPPALYLTWADDPTTTMVVIWHTTDPTYVAGLQVLGPGIPQWLPVTVSSQPMPHSNRMIHVGNITGLQSDRQYRFTINGWSPEYLFRTMPATQSRPITFVTAGDTFRSPTMFEKSMREVARRSPDFIIFGGDIAYVNGNPSHVSDWYDWLAAYTRTSTSSEGNLIPFLAVIGNHEVSGGYGQPITAAPFFYSLFPHLPGRGYGAFDFGDYMSLLLLDSNHTTPIAGDQTTWLAQALQQRQSRPHLMAAYHVAAWSSRRSLSDPLCTLIRNHWIPLFEQYGLDVAFENHEHAYKRTPRIKNNAVDPSGVLYLGDGCFGVDPRPVLPASSHWYLDVTQSINHFILTQLNGGIRSHQAIDSQGRVFDRFPTSFGESTEDVHFTMDRQAEKFLRNSKAPGIAFALVRNGDVCAVRGYGKAEAVERNRVVSPKTSFRTRGLAQPLAALGLLQLADKGLLDLETGVGRYLKAENLAGAEGLQQGEVTLRRVLSSTAGLSPGLEKGIKLVSKPGTVVTESDAAIEIIGRIIEQVCEEPFHEYMARTVLEPLGMKNSGFTINEGVARMLAVGHDEMGAPIEEPPITDKTTLFGSVADFGRFIAAMMPGPNGEPAGRGIVKPETARAMLSDQTEGIAGPLHGLGFRLTEPSAVIPAASRPAVAQGGHRPGWGGLAISQPDVGAAVVILTNGECDPDTLRKMADALIETLVAK